MESLQYYRWYRKLSCFYKFGRNEFLQYLFKLILVGSSKYCTRSMQNVKKYFFLSAIIQWNNIGLNIRNSCWLNIFRKGILKFYHNLTVIILKQVNLSQDWGSFISPCRNTNLHCFQDLLNPISNCGMDIESSLRHFFHYPTYNTERNPFLKILKNIDKKTLDLTE